MCQQRLHFYFKIQQKRPKKKIQTIGRVFFLGDTDFTLFIGQIIKHLVKNNLAITAVRWRYDFRRATGFWPFVVLDRAELIPEDNSIQRLTDRHFANFEFIMLYHACSGVSCDVKWPRPIFHGQYATGNPKEHFQTRLSRRGFIQNRSYIPHLKALDI